LWYDRKHAPFVASFLESLDDRYRLAVDSIQHPVSASIPAGQAISWLIPAGIGAGGVTVLVIGFLLWRKRTVRGRGEAPIRDGARRDTVGGHGIMDGTHGESDAGLADGISRAPQPDSDGRAAIHVFGRFRLVDARMKDWADEFPPKLRELFLFLLLRTMTSGRQPAGVTTTELTAALWPENDASSAKNVRGVSIKRLRDSLENIGGMSVVHADSYWRMEVNDSIGCDLRDLMYLLHDPRSGLTRGDVGEVERFLPIIQRGHLLAGEDCPWLDGIRADVSRSIVEAIARLLRANGSSIPLEALADLADAGLFHEPVNEEFLARKLEVLTALGRHGAAKVAYDAFAEEYAEIAGHPFSRTFQEFCR
jgi:two-component SAPR family response regulator